MMLHKGAIRYGILLIIVFLLWFIASDLYVRHKTHAVQVPFKEAVADQNFQTLPTLKDNGCGLQQSCPAGHFSFYLKTGLANVIGPRICFEGQVIMSGVHNNIGHGLNVVLVNAITGKVEKHDFFNMYSGNVNDLLNFLKDLNEDIIVLVASFDDSASKMTDEVREIFTSLGSSYIKSLQFRDGWLFAGGKGLTKTSPFEKMVKNNAATNFFKEWPRVLSLEGCFPQKFE